MKKLISVVCVVISLWLLASCSQDGTTSTDELPDTSQNTSEYTEIKTVYPTPESLRDAEDIVSLEKAEYTAFASMDMSAFPEEVQDLYRGIMDNTVTYQVLYKVDGCTVSAYISVPTHIENPPLVIYNRGGNGNFGANAAEGIAMYSYYTECVFIASNYRETDPGTGKDEFGGDDVHDVVFWIDLADELGFVDREQIYMIGESRGGMQTCLALLEDDENIIRAAACVSGVYDLVHTCEFRDDMREMLTRRIGGTPEELPEEYARRSAVTFAEKLDTPILLIHSTGDEKVDYAEAVSFAAELEKYGKKYEFITRNDAIHCLSNGAEFVDVIDWLRKNAD